MKALALAGNCVMLSTVTWGFARFWGRRIAATFFWERGRPAVVNAEDRRLAVSATAVARYCGRQTESTVGALAARLAVARRARKRRSLLYNTIGWILALCPTILFVAAIISERENSDAVYLLRHYYRAISAYAVCATAMVVLEQARRQWFRQSSDHRALIACAELLSNCKAVIRRGPVILGANLDVAYLCRALETFSGEKIVFRVEAQREEVCAHTAAVCRELVGVSGGLLRDGPEAAAHFATTLSTLLDRLVAERWLRLLDVDEQGTPGDARGGDREARERDGWVVVGGSLAAAVGLGTSATLGVPLTAAVPGALIFLLGPAMLWGSKRLRPSARQVLTSVEGGLRGASANNEPTRAEATQPPG